jgi:hypothetical protein
MDSIYGGGCDAVPPHKGGVPTRRTSEAYAFWVVLEGGTWGCPLTVLSPEGTEAIALFSGEEEAKMFCHFCAEEGARSTIRQTTAGGVLSLLYCPWSAKRVALDPFPGTLEARPSGPPTLDRARFARRFAGLGSEPRARAPWVEQGAPSWRQAPLRTGVKKARESVYVSG